MGLNLYECDNVKHVEMQEMSFINNYQIIYFRILPLTYKKFKYRSISHTDQITCSRRSDGRAGTKTRSHHLNVALYYPNSWNRLPSPMHTSSLPLLAVCPGLHTAEDMRGENECNSPNEPINFDK